MKRQPSPISTYAEQFARLRERFEYAFQTWPDLRHQLLFFPTDNARKKKFGRWFRGKLRASKEQLVDAIDSRLGRAVWEEATWKNRLTAGCFSGGPPTAEFEKLMQAGRLWHGGHPILAWMAGHCAVRRDDDDDDNDNIMPSKGHSTDRIDGIVAAIIGLSRAMFQEPVRKSVYESRGPIELEW